MRHTYTSAHRGTRDTHAHIIPHLFSLTVNILHNHIEQLDTSMGTLHTENKQANKS